MMTPNGHNLSQQEHSSQKFRIINQVAANAQTSTMANYLESDNTLSSSRNVATAYNSQQRQEGDLARQTYNSMSSFSTSLCPHHQTNPDHWTSNTGNGASEWFSSYKFYVDQERVNETALYGHLQTNVMSPINYCDTKRAANRVKTEAIESHQHQYHSQNHLHASLQGQNTLQHGSVPSNQAYASYGQEDYDQTQRIYHYQPEVCTNHRYHQQQTHPQTNVYQATQNVTPTIREASLNGHSAMYHHYHHDLAAPTAFLTFPPEADARNQQGDHLWPHHEQYLDSGRAQPLSAGNQAQASGWSVDKTNIRAPVVQTASYHNRAEGYYEHRQTSCVYDQGFVSANTNQGINVWHQLEQTQPTVSTRRVDGDASNQRKQTEESTNVIDTDHEKQTKADLEKASTTPSVKPEKDNQNDQRSASIQDSVEAPSQVDRLNRLNQCHICGRHYARPSTLKTHMRTHTNERPYKCGACFKTFSQAANLTAHQRVHTGERPFPCPICGRQFSQSSSVITHLRTHSGERPYRCNSCNRTFSDSSTLTKHCRVHSGEKPYQCDYCPMNFSQSGNLSRHLRLHALGGTSKAHQTAVMMLCTTTTTTTASVTSISSSATPMNNQGQCSSNLSSSPESTISNCSMSSRISSGASNSTSTTTSN